MGRIDVDAMLAEMSSPQFAEWMAFLGLYDDESLRAGAMVSATVANAMGGGNRTWQPRDFLPSRFPAPEQDPDDMLAALMGVKPTEE